MMIAHEWYAGHCAAVVTCEAIARKWAVSLQCLDHPGNDFQARCFCIEVAVDAAILSAFRDAWVRVVVAVMLDGTIGALLSLATVCNLFLAGCYVLKLLARLAGTPPLPFDLPDIYCLLGLALALFTIGLAAQWRAGWRRRIVGV